MRPFIRNHYLPQWLHRITCGGLATVVLALLGLNWLGEPAGSWRHVVSLCLLILSIPVGIICACLTDRFSIVEGVAGDTGYEDLDEKRDEQGN
jgi:heme A synthase